MPKLRLVLILLTTLIAPLTSIYAQGNGDLLAPPAEAELPLGDLVYTADFSDGEVWPEYSDNNLILSPTAAGFQISNTDPEEGLGLFAPTRIDYTDIYTEFSFNIDNCNDDTSAVLVTLRDVGFSDNYVFVLQCDGSYRSRPIIGENIGNVDRRGSADGVAVGTEHHMGMLMIGSTVTWYLDGVELENYTARGALDEGVITVGAQLGMEYTLTAWRVWEIDSPATSGGGDNTSSTNDNPLINEEFTEILYHPEFEPPSTIIYGLHHPIARYYNPNGIGMYNNDETAIMALTEVNAENYYFEVNYIIRSCEDDAVVGLIWRASEDLSDFYVLGVQCDGAYRSRAVIDGEAGDILTSGESIPMVADTLLSISVYVRGDTAWLYYNQELLTSIDSTVLSAGTLGILLQSSTDGATVDILVTDLIVVGVSE